MSPRRLECGGNVEDLFVKSLTHVTMQSTTHSQTFMVPREVSLLMVHLSCLAQVMGQPTREQLCTDTTS